MNHDNAPVARETKGGAVITVKLHPGTSPAGPRDVRNGELHFRVGAPPDKGKANAELIDKLADFLKVRKTDIEIIAGAAARKKQLFIRNADAYALNTKLLQLRTSENPKVAENTSPSKNTEK